MDRNTCIRCVEEILHTLEKSFNCEACPTCEACMSQRVNGSAKKCSGRNKASDSGYYMYHKEFKGVNVYSKRDFLHKYSNYFKIAVHSTLGRRAIKPSSIKFG